MLLFSISLSDAIYILVYTDSKVGWVHSSIKFGFCGSILLAKALGRDATMYAVMKMD